MPLEEGTPPAPAPVPATVEATLAETDVNDSNQTSDQQPNRSPTSYQQTCQLSTSDRQTTPSFIQQTDV